MAKFRFRLESVLRLREMEDDRARRALHEVQRDFQREEQALRDMVELREEAKSDVRGGDDREGDDDVRQVDVQELLRQRRYINVLYQRIVSKGQDLTRIGKEVERAKKSLGEARVRKRIVERLKERKKQEFLREEDRREARELDELGQVYTEYKKETKS